MLVAAAAVVVLAVVAVTLGVVLSSGSSNAAVPARGSLTNALPGAADVQKLLKGIPQQGNVLGSGSGLCLLPIGYLPWTRRRGP